MICIYCQVELTVSNSRPQKSRNQTWRRRPCNGCGAVYTSIEALDLSQVLIMSSDSQKSSSGTMHMAKKPAFKSFDRDRLFISIYESLRHRPTAIRDARGLTDTAVVHLLKNIEDGRLNLRTIVGTVITILERFDEPAATYYKAFNKKHL